MNYEHHAAYNPALEPYRRLHDSDYILAELQAIISGIPQTERALLRDMAVAGEATGISKSVALINDVLQSHGYAPLLSTKTGEDVQFNYELPKIIRQLLSQSE